MKSQLNRKVLMERAGITEDVQAQVQETLEGVKSIFAELKDMPVPEQQKLDLARGPMGGGLLTLLAKSMGVGGMSLAQVKPILQKAAIALQQASTIDAVYQAIVDAVGEWANTED